VEVQPVPHSDHKLARWKRLVLVGLSTGLALGVTLSVGLAAYTWHKNRPTPPKRWPDIDNPSQGIKVTLRTEWRDGEVKYKLRVLPHDHNLVAAFDKGVRAAAKLSSLTVRLEDSSGFELCKIEALELIPEMGDDGLAHSAQNEGDAYGCSRSQYLEAEKWNVAYRFPKISASAVEAEPKERQAASNLKYPLEAEDLLTGFDSFGGHLETRAGHTFVVQREGERMAALLWTTSSRLKYICKTASECLIENTDNGEAVHGRMMR